jgi:hypothetical protein
MRMICLHRLHGLRKAYMSPYVVRAKVNGLLRISGRSPPAVPATQTRAEVVRDSVVFEWLKKKQAEGVERGWKDGGPGA